MKSSIKFATIAAFVLAAPMAEAGKETVPTPGPTVSISTASTAASAIASRAAMNVVMSSVASMAAASVPAASIPSLSSGSASTGGRVIIGGQDTGGVSAGGGSGSSAGSDGGSGGGSGGDTNERAARESGSGNDAPRRRQGTVRVTVADLELILPKPVIESPQVSSLVRYIQSGKPVSPRIIGLLKAYSE